MDDEIEELLIRYGLTSGEIVKAVVEARRASK